MKNSNLTFFNTVIHPGEFANLAMPLPDRYTCAPLYMPIKVLHGLKKGPCLVLFSTLRGDELNGLEIANRIVDRIDPKEIRGTVIAIPVVNVYGLTHFPSVLPSGGLLTNCFPGKEEGNFGERLAYLFTEEILKKSDYCIELQTGSLNHNILPQVYCNFENAEARQLAKAFHSPVVTNVTLEGNRLRQTTEELQIPLLVYQAGEAMRFDEEAINLGVEGVLNVMRTVDILPNQPISEFKSIFSQDEEWIVAHKGGILHPTVSLGQVIHQGEVVGKITDPFGADIVEQVRAPLEGVVVGINSSPFIHEGLQIFKIASFLDPDRAESAIEKWEQLQQSNIETES